MKTLGGKGVTVKKRTHSTKATPGGGAGKLGGFFARFKKPKQPQAQPAPAQPQAQAAPPAQQPAAPAAQPAPQAAPAGEAQVAAAQAAPPPEKKGLFGRRKKGGGGQGGLKGAEAAAYRAAAAPSQASAQAGMMAQAPQQAEYAIKAPVQSLAQAKDNPAALLYAPQQLAQAPASSAAALRGAASPFKALASRFTGRKKTEEQPASAAVAWQEEQEQLAAPEVGKPLEQENVIAQRKAAVPEGYNTWAWPALEQEQKGKSWGKIVAIVLILLLLAAGAAAAVWYFVLREDEKKPAKRAVATKPEKNPTKTTKKAGGAPPLKAFVFDLDPLVKRSAADRVKIVAAVGGVQNGCATAPDEGAAQADAVRQDRSILLKEAGKLKPPNAQASSALAGFKAALTNSIAANKHYIAWMKSLKAGSGCPGSFGDNADFKAAEAASVKATAAKQSFVKAYNPLARKFGKQTWSPDKI